MNLIVLSQDKANHFAYGTIICTISTLIALLLIKIILIPLWLVLLPTIFFAIGKEYYDYKSRKGTPDIKDALFTLAGGLSVYVPSIVQSYVH
jgi:hypothetical protein